MTDEKMTTKLAILIDHIHGSTLDLESQNKEAINSMKIAICALRDAQKSLEPTPVDK